MNGLWAVKPHWDRSRKEYVMEVRMDADPILAHDGWFVFDNVYTAIGMVVCGKMLQHWPDKKRDAVLHWLTCEGGK